MCFNELGSSSAKHVLAVTDVTAPAVAPSKPPVRTATATLEPPPFAATAALIEVAVGSAEFMEVARLLGETPVRVRRVLNPFLEWKFQLRCSEIAAENGGDVNEKMLVHGTRDVPAETVALGTRGVDPHYARQGCMYGPAAYFAVGAAYSKTHNYLDADWTCLVCRVALGRVHRAVRPGYMKHAPHPCHSVTGEVAFGVSAFMVYETFQAIPAYIATLSSV